jgi:selenocysteine lyase/cysteine desulfurase
VFAAELELGQYEAYIARNNYLQERRPELYARLATSAVDTIKSSSEGDSGFSPRVPPLGHFNAAGDSPMPPCVLQKVKRVLDAEQELGGYAAAEEVFAEEFNNIYTLIGALIKSPPDNIALVDSATTAWTRAFYSLDLGENDVVLTCAVEYASNYIALLQHTSKSKAAVITIPSNEDGTVSVSGLVDLLCLHGRRVRAVSITWVPTNGGVVNDAEAIGIAIAAHGPDVLYVLDACQAVGQLPVDVGRLRCHVLSATGRKYLRGPRGTGFLYVSPAGLQMLATPPTLDLLSAPWDGETYAIISTAKRFEQWEKNFAGLLGMGEAMSHLMYVVGEEFAYARIKELAVSLRQELERNEKVVLWDLGTSSDYKSRCGIVTFSVKSVDADTVKEKLRALNVLVSVTGPFSTPVDSSRRGLPRMIRASVHYFNTLAEISYFCDAVGSI